MKQSNRLLAAAFVCAIPALPHTVAAQPAPAIPPSISTPDKVESRLGPLEFKDGAPSKATLEKVYDNLDFTHAFNAFVNTFQGVNLGAWYKGYQNAGVKDNELIIWSELMDAKSLFLTTNADTIYWMGFIDLTKGPMVLETPPRALGTIDDMWWGWVTDFGAPGPDRGVGGKYLILPPGYDGPVPEGGFYVSRSKTTRVLVLGRSFMENSDPKPAVALIKSTTRIYPYEAGGVGTSVIGPQIGYLFPVGDMQGYLNLKGYGEFDAANRPSGWNTWLTFSISPMAPTSTVTPTRRVVTK